MTRRFEFRECPLPGLFSIRRRPLVDSRGFFSRFYCAEEFRELGLQRPIVQMNHSLTTTRGAIRGLHFQYPPHSETKIVNCLRGKVFDVALDIRCGSATFLKWHGEILSAENKVGLYIPEGFAHGFQALSEDCEMIYLHTKAYTASGEGGLNVMDPALDIHWPLALQDRSERDRNHPMVDNSFVGVEEL